MPGYYYWWKYAKCSPYFREYMERQWEIYSRTNREKEKLKKNISYRNILLAAYMIFVVLMSVYKGFMTHGLADCLMVVMLAAVAVFMAAGVRWVLDMFFRWWKKR